MRPALGALVLAAALALAAAATAAADDLSPEALLARYQPVTVLDQGELFAPTSVDDFLADASLLRKADDDGYAPGEMPAAGLPVDGDGWRLDHRCAVNGGPVSAVQCYAPASHGPSVVYGRHEVIAGTTVLQYWLFYEHNFWSLPHCPSARSGRPTRVIGRSSRSSSTTKRTPVEAGYSQHCTGERRAWDDGRLARPLRAPAVRMDTVSELVNDVHSRLNETR